MNFFNKIKNFAKEVSELDKSINVSKKDYLEIYERNKELEKEIAERTQELNQANKTILTLQLIWEMMNSSTPLSSVLQKIIGSLASELNYINCTIVQLNDTTNEKFFECIATTEGSFMKKFSEVAHQPVENYTLKYNKNGIFEKCINEKKIIYSNEFINTLTEIFNDIDPAYITKTMKNSQAKGMILCPLFAKSKTFGCLLVFSTRPEPQQTELHFLSLFAQQIELAVTITGLFEEVKKQATTDPLTDLFNRRFFENAIKKEAERSLRSNMPFSIVSLDLDYLKKINDTFGHHIGDIAIKVISNVLKTNARAIDIPARFGGEEFSILLPGIDSNGAISAAERIRTHIQNTKIEQVGHITASIGVATFLEHTNDVDDLIELADQAMYKAKINGRNQVVVAKTKDASSWQETAIDAFVDIISKNRIPIDEDIAIDICSKLKNISQKEDGKELIYSIVDMLAKTYNPASKKGSTRTKVSKAIKLARKLELPKEDIDKLRIATLLYDIGNIMLPETIFSKSAPLTEQEKKQIHQHPVIAAKEILSPISSIGNIIPIIENHHENWDGSGYPYQKSGQEIPIESQIILIIDAYCALTQQRAYRPKMNEEKALEIIKSEAGKKWSPQLVDTFVDMINSED